MGRVVGCRTTPWIATNGNCESLEKRAHKYLELSHGFGLDGTSSWVGPSELLLFFITHDGQTRGNPV